MDGLARNVVRCLPPTWRAHGIGRYEWTSGRSEDTLGCVADSAVYLPLDLAKMVYDDLDGYRSRLDQALQLTQKETGELVKQILKSIIHAAEQSRLREPLTLAVTSNDGDGMIEDCKPRLTTLRWLAALIVCTALVYHMACMRRPRPPDRRQVRRAGT